MVGYAIRRLLLAVPMVFIASMVMFLLVALSGDPLAQLRGQEPPPSPETLAALEERLYLDRSLPERYLLWLGGILRGDFGPSVNNVDIGSEVGDRIGVTASLVVTAMVVSVVVAVVLGVINALRQYSSFDKFSTLVTFLLLSTPVFWLAAVFKQGAVAVNDRAGATIFYTVGGPDSVTADGLWQRVAVVFGVLAIPTVVMSLNSVAKFSRYARGEMLDVLNRDYMTLAYAKGLSRRRVILRHGLRTSLIPMVTVVALESGEILGGAVVTELIFQWRGMGDFLFTSIRDYDVYAVLAWLLVASLCVIIFNLLADLVYGWLDPRIRVRS